MPNGIVIIDKPAGWTSMDVCAKLRGIFHEKRVGHAGTLDPMATGVLPVFIGAATKAVSFAEDGKKEYVAGLRLGITTDTQDITGTELERRSVAVTREQLEALLPRFTGDIQQIPPMYSAIKINGQKLYDLARKGQNVERKPRSVTIYELEVTQQLDDNTYQLRCVCSKGTYIRTLCHDIGQALGCGGTMAALRRTRAAGFSLEQAVTLERAAAAEDPQALLLPVEAYFSHSPALTLPGAWAEKKIRNGNPVVIGGADGTYRVYSGQKEFLALGRLKDGCLTTIKSFFEV